MIEVEQFDWGLRAVDAAKNQVEIEIDDWEVGGRPFELNRHVDARIAGYGSEIRIPGQTVVFDSGKSDKLEFLEKGNCFSSKDGPATIQADDVISTYVTITDETSIENEYGNNIILSFKEKSPMTISLRSHLGCNNGSLGTSRDIQGLGHAISRFGDYHRTDTPDRSYPSMRGHPPLIEFHDPIEGSNHDDSQDRPLVLTIPESLDVLFRYSPFAYYTSAQVCLSNSNIVEVSTHSESIRIDSKDSPQYDAESILKTVFYLDCLVRNVGPNGIDLHENRLLDSLPFDPEVAYNLPMSDRVLLYLTHDVSDLFVSLPNWPLSVAVARDLNNALALPHIAHNLAIVCQPKVDEFTPETIIRESLEQESHPNGTYRRYSSKSAIKTVNPVSLRGMTNAWLAEGTAIDAYNLIPRSVSNKFDFLGGSQEFELHIVSNEKSMASESITVSDEYQSMNPSFSSVEVHENITREMLAEVLESPIDFLHYIGHTDEEGFLCRDGRLSTTSLNESKVQTFFLNACRSYPIGAELINLGSVAGGVTVNDVLHRQAKKVGTAFARLIKNGQSIDTALRLAKNESIINKNYTVVGDGTHTIFQGANNFSEVLYLSKIGSGKFEIQSQSYLPQFHGAVTQNTPFHKPTLMGNDDSHQLNKSQLEKVLSDTVGPIVFDNRLFWSDDIATEVL